MPRTNQLISAPTLHLFAFQQPQEFFARNSLLSLAPEWVTDKYRQILNHFHVCQTIKFKATVPREHLFNHQKSPDQSILQPQKFGGTIKAPEQLEVIEGKAYPSCLDTTHIIALKINRLKNKVEEFINVNKLASFNPKNCFDPSNIQTNLGQTVMITAVVNPSGNKQPNSLKSLADSCLSSFTHLPSSAQQTVLLDSSKIFNGCLFTYYLAGKSHQYNQIIVGLFFSPEAQENFHQQHQQLSQFLLSLHKLTYVYQHSSSLLNLAGYHIRQLKYHLSAESHYHSPQIASPTEKNETTYPSISPRQRRRGTGFENSWFKPHNQLVAVLT